MNLTQPQITSITPVQSSLAGLHIIADLSTKKIATLTSSSAFKSFINNRIDELALSKVGEVFHDFDNGAFTAVICLTESHLSIHTWPEREFLTFDIYLSNYLHDNTSKTKEIYQAVKEYFNAVVIQEHFLNR